MESQLRDWFPKGDDGVGLWIPEGVSSESIASLKAEHVDAYCTGHAFTYASHTWDCCDCDSLLGQVAYAQGVMAWIAGDHHSLVKSLDLRTGQKRSFLSGDRTLLVALAMSSSMVVALSLEGCHVWSLTSGENHFLRYRGSDFAAGFVSVSDKSFACAYPKYATGEEHGFNVLTWTLKDQRPSLFFLAIPTETNAQSIMLDRNGETLLFFYVSRSGAPMQYCYSRTNLDGDGLAQGVIEIPSLKTYHDCSFYAVPTEANGRAVIWSLAKPPREVRNFSELLLICYNFQENRLEIRAQMVDGLGRGGMNINTTSHLFYWKDAAYYLDHESGSCFSNFRVVDLQELTCSDAKMDIPTSTSDMHVHHWEHGPLLFGDETFLITTFGPCLGVWCFDRNVQLFNEDIDYKENRKKKIKERLDLKRER